MSEIEKPKRTIGKITRSRSADANRQGNVEQVEDRFMRLVEFQKAVGIRRAELARLTPSDIIQTRDGRVYVHVARGKGERNSFRLFCRIILISCLKRAILPQESVYLVERK